MDNINFNSDVSHKLTILTLQIIALINATTLGWRIKSVDGKKFIICKKVSEMTDLDNDTLKFLDTIIRFNECTSF